MLCLSTVVQLLQEDGFQVSTATHSAFATRMDPDRGWELVADRDIFDWRVYLRCPGWSVLFWVSTPTALRRALQRFAPLPDVQDVPPVLLEVAHA